VWKQGNMDISVTVGNTRFTFKFISGFHKDNFYFQYRVTLTQSDLFNDGDLL
jgi:hypothetical protein